MTTSFPHRLLAVDDCSIAVATRPAPSTEAPILVWVHGLGEASGTFAEVVQHPSLAAITSVLIDLPGAGHSQAPETWGGTIEDLAGVVVRTIEAVAPGPVVLFGHSLGGSVAIAAATQRPALIRLLIVAEPNLDPGKGAISLTISRQEEAAFVAYGFQRLVEATSRLARRGNGEAASWLPQLLLADPRHLHRAATSLLAPREPTFRQQLTALPIPTATISGDRTPLLDPPLSRRVNPRGYVVPQAGHQMFHDNPEAFVATLAEILAPTMA